MLPSIMIDIVSFLILLSFIVIAALWILVPALYGLPPVTTHRERIRKALQMANLQPDEILYDLGSGHGRVLVIAAKEFGAHAVGIEVGPVQCVIAGLNALYNGVGSKVRVEAKDFYSADISQADVVYAYLTSKQAPRLQAQLEKQLKRGARVVTISFDFPDWKPTFINREQLIFLYQMPPEY
jgi:cyclopropane fatty-acyl-phospholipid synthase-like methyltransferase